MDNSTEDELCEQLETTDSSIFFLILLILAILLSFWSILIQRRQLVCTIAGDTEAASAAPPVYPIRHGASALTVGGLGFFLCLAIRAAREAAAGTDCIAKRSANTNLWASLFVFAGAVLRLSDLEFLASNPSSPESALVETEVLPDT